MRRTNLSLERRSRPVLGWLADHRRLLLDMSLRLTAILIFLLGAAVLMFGRPTEPPAADRPHPVPPRTGSNFLPAKAARAA